MKQRKFMAIVMIIASACMLCLAAKYVPTTRINSPGATVEISKLSSGVVGTMFITGESYGGTGSAFIAGPRIGIPTNSLDAAQALRVTCWGTQSGGNSATTVALWDSSTVIMSLASGTTTPKDWVAEFVISNIDDRSHQRIMGRLLESGVNVVDVADKTLDFGAAQNLYVKIKPGHSGDADYIKNVIVETLP